MKFPALLLTLFLAQAAAPDPEPPTPTKEPSSPAEVKVVVEQHMPIVLSTTIDIPDGWSATADWTYEAPFGGLEIKGGAAMAGWAPPSQEAYRVYRTITFGKIASAEPPKIEFKKAKTLFLVTVLDETPKPPDPPEPPDVDPTPEPPDPPEEEPPFEAPGFAIMIIEEASERGRLPAEQVSVFTDPDIRRFVTEVVEIPGGEGAFFRVIDDDYTDFQLRFWPDSLRDAYRSVLTQADGNLPWLAVTDGKSGYSGPLPGNVEETVELLNKFKD